MENSVDLNKRLSVALYLDDQILPSTFYFSLKMINNWKCSWSLPFYEKTIVNKACDGKFDAQYLFKIAKSLVKAIANQWIASSD